MRQEEIATVPSSYTPTYRRETLCVFWDRESIHRARRRGDTAEVERPATETPPELADTQVEKTQLDKTQLDKIDPDACERGLDVLPSDELGLDRPLFDFLVDPSPAFQLSILAAHEPAEDEPTHVCTIVEPVSYVAPSREVRTSGMPPLPRDVPTAILRAAPRSRPRRGEQGDEGARGPGRGGRAG